MHERTLPCDTTRDERRVPGSQCITHCAFGLELATPGNTAGPVLPHRPSETPPVLRNHREGLVTCSTVATCPEKTTPVGLLVTRRKHQRFQTGRFGCSRQSPTRGITWSRTLAAAWPPACRTGCAVPAASVPRLAHRPAAPGRGPAARAERRRSPLVALAGNRAPAAASSTSTGTPGSPCREPGAGCRPDCPYAGDR